jgi:glutamate synthase (NADPH/NADH) small chain
LNRAGHWVTVFEKADRPGGLLRYGIPDFKLEKRFIDRRLGQLIGEGIRIETRSHVGHNVPIEDLREEFDAILLAGGAEQPRDLNVPGRELKGIHFAMDFLPQQNKRVAGDRDLATDPTRLAEPILATGKRVVIIGGGDTGADCLGTCHRQRARSVCQFEILPKPPDQRSESTPWPLWPLQLRIESAHEEGGIRDWSVATTGFSGDSNGHVSKIHAVKVGPPPKFEPVPGSEFTMDVDLVLLAMGFTGPVRGGLIEQLGLELDGRGNVACDENYMTSAAGVFAAGDMRRGQSLVVWAIHEGRQAARAIDLHLMGQTRLP